MLYTILWYTALVLLGVHLYKWGRYAFQTVLFFFERMTAPTISVSAPVVQFPPKDEVWSKPFNSDSPDTIFCFDKGTGAPLGQVNALSKDQVKTVVDKARKAQVEWAKTSFSTRRKLLFALLDYVVKNQELICQTSSVECGKTIMDGFLGEILTTTEKLRWTCAQGEEVLQEEVRDVGLITMHKRASVSYVPIGVVGAIVSWNYPFHNIFGPMISALFAGNAFVGKVSEYASYYTKYYQDIVHDGLVKLGQSPDLVTFLTGFAQTGEALVETADKITFIGSPGVGKKVMEKASHTLTPVVLELGGKDPAIICEDCDFDQVISIVMRGTFQNCGQNCVGLERVVAHEKIYEKLKTVLTTKISALSQGAASQGLKDCGAMTMGKLSVDKIQKLIDETVAQGGKLICGGKSNSSNFYPPTMIADVTPNMAIALEEVFGPVLVLMKFTHDQEAVDMVNACPYGLGSSVFSMNIPRAQAIASKLKTGMCNVNDFGINYLCQSLPFGGCKMSGFDRFAGREGLRGNCIVRSQTTDRIPGVKTTIPPVLQYPIKESATTFMVNLVTCLYGTWASCIGSAIKLASFKP